MPTCVCVCLQDLIRLLLEGKPEVQILTRRLQALLGSSDGELAVIDDAIEAIIHGRIACKHSYIHVMCTQSGVAKATAAAAPGK